MGSEPDDTAGPPPDPTERTWRHPSEIAAAHAFAAREEARDRRRPSGWTLAMGSATGVALCIGVFVIASSVRLGPAAGGAELTAASIGTARGGSSTSAPAATMLGASMVSSTSPTSTPAATVAAPQPASIATLPDDLGGFDASGIHLVLDGETPIANAVDGAVLGDIDLSSIDPAELEIPTTVAAALTESTAGSASSTTSAPAPQPRVERILLTSASATAGAIDLRVVLDGEPRAAVVIAADRYTDVAVVGVWALEGAAPGSGPNQTSTGEGAAAIDRDGSEEEATTGDIVLVAGYDAPRVEHLGRLVARGKQAVAIDGHPLIDTLVTSARLPAAGAGSALCDASGRIIGLVVHGDAQLAVAVPIERATATAVALLRHGWAGGGHLGIEGIVTELGIRLTAVDPEGPAAAAGFEVGDIVTAVEGASIGDFAELVTVLRNADAGQILPVTILRGDETIELDATLGGD